MLDYYSIFNTLSSNEYYKIRSISDILINDNVFLKKIIKVQNPLVFDRFTKMVQYKMDTTRLCEERNKYIEKVILNETEELPSNWLTEYIISYFFQDNYYNFITNLFQMVRYIRHVEKHLVNANNLKIYNEFNNINKLSTTEKIALFKKYQSRRDLMQLFYDDLTKVREISHQKLVDCITKLNKDSKLYCEDISDRLDVDVYTLDGEKFYGFVRCFSFNVNDLKDHSADIFSRKDQLGYSFSYIGKENIGTIDYSRTGVSLYYDDINYKNIMYVHHSDLHAKKMVVQDDYLSEQENDILSPDSLIANTKNYNEVYIKSNNGIKPKALICYDTIRESDVSFAKRYGLDVLLIIREKYHQVRSFDDDYDDYKYYL